MTNFLYEYLISFFIFYIKKSQTVFNLAQILSFLLIFNCK
ncbi:hypothetical Protein psc5_07770 [Candidatus Phytoplasma solani]